MHIETVLIILPVILLSTKIFSLVFERFKLPTVLGELICGIFIGNLILKFYPEFSYLLKDKSSSLFKTFHFLAEIGAILLLFEIGLETTFKEMKAVGKSSLMVAVIGVIMPLVFGYKIGQILISEQSPAAHLFLGATLAATSVGITARVFKDLGLLGTSEAKIVLGAAVIDDILGLILLSTVQGIVLNGFFDVRETSMMFFATIVFMGGSIYFGKIVNRAIFKADNIFSAPGIAFIMALSLCLILAFVSHQLSLSMIVGGFLAGLILEGVVPSDIDSESGHKLKPDLIKLKGHFNSLNIIFIPIFFFMMGLEVDLGLFFDSSLLFLAAVITFYAVVGKVLAGYFVFDKGLDKQSIGIAMIPRGEVGLIFAGIGKSLTINGLPVISDKVYSAIIIMIIITTVLTPPLLAYSLKTFQKRKAKD